MDAASGCAFRVSAKSISESLSLMHWLLLYQVSAAIAGNSVGCSVLLGLAEQRSVGSSCLAARWLCSMLLLMARALGTLAPLEG